MLVSREVRLSNLSQPVSSQPRVRAFQDEMSIPPALVGTLVLVLFGMKKLLLWSLSMFELPKV